jgi:hypothetical protein
MEKRAEASLTLVREIFLRFSLGAFSSFDTESFAWIKESKSGESTASLISTSSTTISSFRLLLLLSLLEMLVNGAELEVMVVEAEA